MMPRTRVKFCGVMRPADAVAAADAGADAVGMILHADARRLIDAPTAAAIVGVLPPYVSPVGVFVNASTDVVRTLSRFLNLSHAQLHGEETIETVAALERVRTVKAFKMSRTLGSDLASWRQAYLAGNLPGLVGILIDGAGGGGTGHANDFAALRRMSDAGDLDGLPPLSVAGGLTPENVGDVVRGLRPYAVDTSSGIESVFGEKSVDRMRAFVRNVQTTQLI